MDECCAPLGFEFLYQLSDAAHPSPQQSIHTRGHLPFPPNSDRLLAILDPSWIALTSAEPTLLLFKLNANDGTSSKRTDTFKMSQHPSHLISNRDSTKLCAIWSDYIRIFDFDSKNSKFIQPGITYKLPAGNGKVVDVTWHSRHAGLFYICRQNEIFLFEKVTNGSYRLLMKKTGKNIQGLSHDAEKDMLIALLEGGTCVYFDDSLFPIGTFRPFASLTDNEKLSLRGVISRNNYVISSCSDKVYANCTFSKTTTGCRPSLVPPSSSSLSSERVNEDSRMYVELIGYSSRKTVDEKCILAVSHSKCTEVVIVEVSRCNGQVRIRELFVRERYSAILPFYNLQEGHHNISKMVVKNDMLYLLTEGNELVCYRIRWFRHIERILSADQSPRHAVAGHDRHDADLEKSECQLRMDIIAANKKMKQLSETIDQNVSDLRSILSTVKDELLELTRAEATLSGDVAYLNSCKRFMDDEYGRCKPLTGSILASSNNVYHSISNLAGRLSLIERSLLSTGNLALTKIHAQIDSIRTSLNGHKQAISKMFPKLPHNPPAYTIYESDANRESILLALLPKTPHHQTIRIGKSSMDEWDVVSDSEVGKDDAAEAAQAESVRQEPTTTSSGPSTNTSRSTGTASPQKCQEDPDSNCASDGDGRRPVVASKDTSESTAKRSTMRLWARREPARTTKESSSEVNIDDDDDDDGESDNKDDGRSCSDSYGSDNDDDDDDDDDEGNNEDEGDDDDEVYEGDLKSDDNDEDVDISMRLNDSIIANIPKKPLNSSKNIDKMSAIFGKMSLPRESSAFGSDNDENSEGRVERAGSIFGEQHATTQASALDKVASPQFASYTSANSLSFSFNTTKAEGLCAMTNLDSFFPLAPASSSGGSLFGSIPLEKQLTAAKNEFGDKTENEIAIPISKLKSNGQKSDNRSLSFRQSKTNHSSKPSPVSEHSSTVASVPSPGYPIFSSMRPTILSESIAQQPLQLFPGLAQSCTTAPLASKSDEAHVKSPGVSPFLFPSPSPTVSLPVNVDNETTFAESESLGPFIVGRQTGDTSFSSDRAVKLDVTPDDSHNVSKGKSADDGHKHFEFGTDAGSKPRTDKSANITDAVESMKRDSFKETRGPDSINFADNTASARTESMSRKSDVKSWNSRGDCGSEEISDDDREASKDYTSEGQTSKPAFPSTTKEITPQNKMDDGSQVSIFGKTFGSLSTICQKSSNEKQDKRDSLLNKSEATVGDKSSSEVGSSELPESHMDDACKDSSSNAALSSKSKTIQLASEVGCSIFGTPSAERPKTSGVNQSLSECDDGKTVEAMEDASLMNLNALSFSSFTKTGEESPATARRELSRLAAANESDNPFVGFKKDQERPVFSFEGEDSGYVLTTNKLVVTTSIASTTTTSPQSTEDTQPSLLASNGSSSSQIKFGEQSSGVGLLDGSGMLRSGGRMITSPKTTASGLFGSLVNPPNVADVKQNPFMKSHPPVGNPSDQSLPGNFANTSLLFGVSTSTNQCTPDTANDKTTSDVFGSSGIFAKAPATTTTGSLGIFGTLQPSATTANLLATTPVSNTISASSLFETTPVASATSSLFGAIQATNTTSSLFGKTPAASTTSSLLETTPAASTTSSLFGTTPTANTTPSLFGTTPVAIATSSLFGSTPAASATSSLFGTTPAAGTSTSSLFGTTPAASATSNLFGTTPAASATSSPFGITPAVKTTPSLLGTTPAASTTSSLFGTTPTANTTPSMFGTMPAASTTSSLFGTTPSANTSSSLFGTTPVSNTTSSLFGTTPVSNTTSSLFGTTPVSNTTSSLFGTTPVSNTTSSLFGTTPVSNTTSSMFGTTSVSNTTSSLFGTTPAAGTSTSSLFGTTPAAGTSTSSLFGTKLATGTSASFFGTTLASRTSPASSFFGAIPSSKADTSIFGTAPTSGGEGITSGRFGTTSVGPVSSFGMSPNPFGALSLASPVKTEMEQATAGNTKSIFDPVISPITKSGGLFSAQSFFEASPSTTSAAGSSGLFSGTAFNSSSGSSSLFASNKTNPPNPFAAPSNPFGETVQSFFGGSPPLLFGSPATSSVFTPSISSANFFGRDAASADTSKPGGLFGAGLFGKNADTSTTSANSSAVGLFGSQSTNTFAAFGVAPQINSPFANGGCGIFGSSKPGNEASPAGGLFGKSSSNLPSFTSLAKGDSEKIKQEARSKYSGSSFMNYRQ